MAGKLIVDTIDTDNSFITLNVQQSTIATLNVSGIYSNTGIKMVGADGSVGGVSNTAITGNIISSQITSVANTQITGLITTSQIATVANTQITGNIISSQISPNLTLNGNTTVTSYVEAVVAIGTVTTSSTIALTNGTVQTATLTASTACTFTMPTNVAGKSFVLLLKQAASTGNGTATFTGVKFGTAGAPTITATAGKMDILTFIADGTNWYGSISQGYTP
jgi:hypothetical protein